MARVRVDRCGGRKALFYRDKLLYHNPCVGGSNPSSATNFIRSKDDTSRREHLQRAHAFTAQSFKISGLNASPWPGRSGAVIMPFLTGTGLTHRSSARPMSSIQSPFGMEASNCTFNSG